MNKFGRSLPSSSRQKGVRVLTTPNLIALTKDGDYNIRDHRLCNVKSPTEDSDAVNRKFVDSITFSLLAKIDKSSNDGVKRFNALDAKIQTIKQQIAELSDDRLKKKLSEQVIQKSLNPLDQDLKRMNRIITRLLERVEALETKNSKN